MDVAMDDACEEHWNSEALRAGNPECALPMTSKKTTARSVLVVIIRCLSKVSTISCRTYQFAIRIFENDIGMFFRCFQTQSLFVSKPCQL